MASWYRLNITGETSCETFNPSRPINAYFEANWRIFPSVSWAIIGFNKGLSPLHYLITVDVLLIGPLGTHFGQIWIEIKTFPYRKKKCLLQNGGHFVLTSIYLYQCPPYHFHVVWLTLNKITTKLLVLGKCWFYSNFIAFSLMSNSQFVIIGWDKVVDSQQTRRHYLNHSWHRWMTSKCTTRYRWVNTLRPRLNDRQFPDDIFKCIFLNWNIQISTKI